jgi:hypothetical protein
MEFSVISRAASATVVVGGTAKKCSVFTVEAAIDKDIQLVPFGFETLG